MGYWGLLVGAVISAVVYVVVAQIHDLIMERVRTGKPSPFDLRGTWYVAWDTVSGGKKTVTNEKISIKQKRNIITMTNEHDSKGIALSPSWPWRMECEIFHDKYVLGQLLPTKENQISRGVVFFKLSGSHPSVIDCMVGMWTGFNEASDFARGYTVIAEEREFAEKKVLELVEKEEA